MPTNPDPTADILTIARRIMTMCEKATAVLGAALEVTEQTRIELAATLSTFEAQRSGMTPQPPAGPKDADPRKDAETPEARKAREAKEEREASEHFQSGARQHR